MPGGRRMLAVWILFAGSALIGPVLQQIRLQIAHSEGMRSSIAARVLKDVVAMLWPAQPLAVIEVNVGSRLALAVAVGGNVLLFSLVGLLAVAAARRRLLLVGLYVVVCGLVVLFAQVRTGFDWPYVGIPGASCAVALQALLFVQAAHLTDRGSGRV